MYKEQISRNLSVIADKLETEDETEVGVDSDDEEWEEYLESENEIGFDRQRIKKEDLEQYENEIGFGQKQHAHSTNKILGTREVGKGARMKAREISTQLRRIAEDLELATEVRLLNTISGTARAAIKSN
jgi:hypothetical protein